MSAPLSPETRPVRFKQVVIVDLDEAWALVMRDTVARGGFCVVLPASIDEAVRLIREQVPDLLLVSSLLTDEIRDLLLPEIELLKSPPPVVLVGLRDTETRWDAWKSRPFVSVIKQPFRTEDVLKAVKTLLDTPWAELR